LSSPAEPVLAAGPDINDLKRRKENLSKEIQILEGRASKTSVIAVEFEKLSKDVNQKELEYNAVKDKLDRARMLRDQAREGPVKVIDPAAPPTHASTEEKDDPFYRWLYSKRYLRHCREVYCRIL
jgi:uncharacterized protein involved in exopolysaccharide biosynthesis